MNREVTLYDFDIEDLNKMNLIYHEGEDVEAFKLRLEAMSLAGEAKTIEYKDRIIACIGYALLWQGVCEVWMVPNEPIDHKGILALALVESIKEFVLPRKFHRVQATLLDGCPSERFFKRLGFEREGPLRQYSPSKLNYNMWSRIL